jgi:hypothetical protein
MLLGFASLYYEEVVTPALQISWNLLRFSQHNFRGWPIFERMFDEAAIRKTIFCQRPSIRDFVLHKLVDFLPFKWVKNNKIRIGPKFVPDFEANFLPSRRGLHGDVRHNDAHH